MKRVTEGYRNITIIPDLSAGNNVKLLISLRAAWGPPEGAWETVLGLGARFKGIIFQHLHVLQLFADGYMRGPKEGLEKMLQRQPPTVPIWYEKSG